MRITAPIIIFFVVLFLISKIIPILAIFLGFILVLVLTTIIVFIGFHFYTIYFFKSEKFIAIKNSIQDYIKNCNDLNHHINDLKCSFLTVRSYDFGKSKMKDISIYNYKRIEWSKELKNRQIHNCSASVCKNASIQPFKYLFKYFDIEINKNTLTDFERVLNDFAAVEQGKLILQRERNSILEKIKHLIPPLIYSYRIKKLIQYLGFEDIDLSDLYFPIYTFLYVSSGGNSSTKCDIILNVENLDQLIKYLNNLLILKNSIDGQRALMTSNLRERIKERDNYTCQKCHLSSNDEKNLLLEIDHILPLSRGGITSEDNLQTLCWKCNRSKGSKIETIDPQN